ncbi:MAG: hypothetical protein ACRERC_18575 [Candidatus Binatia bacterium]
MLLSAPLVHATAVPECCVCDPNCPAANTQVCFAEHAGDDCTTLCGTIGCEPVDSVPNSPCTAIQDCAERGTARCADGFDNNVNGLIDCADPGCSLAPNCAHPAPALDGAGLAGLAAAVTMIGAWSIVRRRSI